jgi:glucose-6-phosphate isomerase
MKALNVEISKTIDLSKKFNFSQEKLVKYSDTLKEKIGAKYDTPYASLHVPYDVTILESVQRMVEQKMAKDPSIVFVVGIGGSNLGAWAIQQALLGSYYNDISNSLKIYYVDTVDSDNTIALLALARITLQGGKTILINIVSKSGTTTETVALAQFFLDLLQEYHSNDYHNYVVVTTDKNSVLHAIGLQKGYGILSVDSFVGGRYSVLSHVGLFPLAMLGVDCSALIQGAQYALSRGLSDDLEINSCIKSASVKYEQYKQGVYINDMFLFGSSLAMLGTWYRQLVGESLGKKGIHIVPTVSIGSTDLHSVGQLYLGGSAPIFTSFVYTSREKSILSLPQSSDLQVCVNHVQGIDISTIMSAIFQATQESYEQQRKPFLSIILQEKSPFYIGQFVQWCMLEVIYLGYLLDVNPFDQPQVELYKQKTREILANERV